MLAARFEAKVNEDVWKGGASGAQGSLGATPREARALGRQRGPPCEHG